MNVGELKQILNGIDDDFDVSMSVRQGYSAIIGAIHIDTSMKDVELRSWVDVKRREDAKDSD